jgi:hypothetical protein
VVGPAAFLALLWPRLRDGRTERTVALAGAAIALAATPFFPPGLPVVLAAVAALGAALLPAAGTGEGPAPGAGPGTASGTGVGATLSTEPASGAGAACAAGPDEAPRTAGDGPRR